VHSTARTLCDTQSHINLPKAIGKAGETGPTASSQDLRAGTSWVPVPTPQHHSSTHPSLNSSSTLSSSPHSRSPLSSSTLNSSPHSNSPPGEGRSHRPLESQESQHTHTDRIVPATIHWTLSACCCSDRTLHLSLPLQTSPRNLEELSQIQSPILLPVHVHLHV
jgi:hypothetical protein